MKRAFTFFIGCFFYFGVSNAQESVTDTARVFRITLSDESEILCNIRGESNDTLTVLTLSRVQIYIPVRQIKKKQELRGTVESGGFVKYDPNITRLFFAPTAETLPQGTGYFAVYELFFPFLAFGVTDRFTISGGMTLFPGVAQQVFYLTPKYRVWKEENVSISAGALFISAFEQTINIAYAVTTFRSRRGSFTAGAGWGMTNSVFGPRPLITAGGEFQLSNYTKLITENWLPPEGEGALLSFGLRFFGEHLAADFGLFTFTGEDMGSWPFFPWVGFVYNF